MYIVLMMFSTMTGNRRWIVSVIEHDDPVLDRVIELHEMGL